MENVPDVIGTKNYPDFMKWYAFLESIGYQSYYKILNAKDFGVPQNRSRCFMVSILGDYNYEFPREIPLELRLKDMLEDEVDEKYYLSEKMVNYFQNHSKECEEKGNGFRFKPTDGNSIARTCTTHPSQSRMDDNFIKVYGNLSGGKWDTTNESCRRVYSSDGISPTITTMGGGNQEPKIIEPICLNSKVNGKQPSVQDRIYDTEGISTAITTSFMPSIQIKEATQKGYDEAYEGDYVNLAYPDSTTRRGRVGKQVANTLLCNDNNGVVVSDAKIIQKGHGYVQDSENAICPSITSSAFHENNFVKEANGVYTNDSEDFHCDPLEGLSRTLKANNHDAGIVENNCRIRKLTPLECWRLMGFTDDDFYKAAKVNSNSQLYKQAGNSIVKQVLMAIFKELL